MSDFAWVFPDRMLRQRNEFSGEWIISQRHVHVPWQDLIGSSVWLIKSVAGKRIIFGHLKVIKAGKAVSDIGKDTVTIIVDRCLSFGVLPKSNDVLAWEIAKLDGNLGLRVMTEAELRELRTVIKTNKTFSLRKNASPPSAIKSVSLNLPVHTLARKVFSAITSTHALGDLRYSSKQESSTPFGEVAINAIPLNFPNVGKIKSEMLRLDKEVAEILTGVKGAKRVSQAKASGLRMRAVDTDLVVINPNSISSRLFFASAFDLPKGKNAIEKTQKAEKRHQNILKAMATALKSLNLQPMQSGSVDLATVYKDRLFIFEIKSAHSANLVAQTKHALIQILEYRMAFQKEGHKKIQATVVVEDAVVATSLKSHLTEFSSHLETKLIWFKHKTILSDIQKILT